MLARSLARFSAWRFVAVLLMTACGATAFSSPASAQQDSTSAVGDSQDVSSMRTPRGSVIGYLQACRRGDYVAAAHHLNLDGPDQGPESATGSELARQFKIVLDKKLWIQADRLSDAAEGIPGDGLQEDFDLVGTVETSRGPVDIVVERRQLPSGARVWMFSQSTVEAIPQLYDEFGYGALGELLPQFMFEWRLLELELWQWIGILVLVLVSYLLSWVLSFVLIRISRTLVQRTKTNLDDRLLQAAGVPLRLVVAVAMFALGAKSLSLPVIAQGFLSSVEKIFFVVALTMFLMRAIDILSVFIEDRLAARGVDAVSSIAPLGRRTAQVILLSFALIALLQNLGVNVSGLIAGLGIGGLALALAAQKSVENLFGGATLVADQPVRVGDFCRYGDKIGTVEDIGLRSTRIRSLDRTIVTVPNAEFSSMQLENFGKRDRIRLYTMIGVRYETSAEQLRHLLVEIKKLLASHPKILAEPARVRFVGFGAYSIDLEVFAYVETQDWNEFLAVREDVFLRLIDIIEASGTGFAFPSQTLYLGRDGGLDEEATRRAEEAVADWRKGGKLPLPDPTSEMLSAMDDSLDYPPEGSVAITSAR